MHFLPSILVDKKILNMNALYKAKWRCLTCVKKIAHMVYFNVSKTYLKTSPYKLPPAKKMKIYTACDSYNVNNLIILKLCCLLSLFKRIMYIRRRLYLRRFSINITVNQLLNKFPKGVT